MGIVLNQSFKNTLILILGFAIGGINALYLYIHYLNDEDYYGLIIFLLSTANILLPVISFGMQHSVIKFFSSYNDKDNQDRLLSWSLIIPMLVITPLAIAGILGYEKITLWLSGKNNIIENYTYLIFLIAIFMGYFEVFYAWTKVQLNSVFGNFVREIFARVCASILLIAVFFKWINPQQFVYAIAIVYFLRMLIMLGYALRIYVPKFSLKKPEKFTEIIRYSIYLIVAGSAATILLEIDKFMIPQMEQIAKVAYYSVGIYIASVVAIPSRAMQQITNPLVAKFLNNNELGEVDKLYKQSSINLLIVGGLLFLLINLNIIDMYKIINRPEYAVGVLIVLLISISELLKLILGINGTILVNSKYYRVFFYFSIAMAATVIILNKILIKKMGIDGAALATLITILVFNFYRFWYIKRKFNMQPFTSKTLLVIVIITLLYLGGIYITFSSIPLLNIILKSVLITIVYAVLMLVFKASDDINGLVQNLLRKKSK